MYYPTKVVDLELSRPLETLKNLEPYFRVQALVRYFDDPLGYVLIPIRHGQCTVDDMVKCIITDLSDPLIEAIVRYCLASPLPTAGVSIEALVTHQRPSRVPDHQLPSVTVAVCTRDRTADLKLCLAALAQLDYPHLEFLIVDNAPTTDATRQLVENNYPYMRYVCEPTPGLDWARNRAALEATGDIIAYTDDDVIVDRHWARAYGELFAENPAVMAATGLVVPYELETEAQLLFERYGGFGRGFQRFWTRIHPKFDEKAGRLHAGSGKFGTGANMAYRRALFAQIGFFDPALDVGTVTNGGGDLEMFFRTVKEGHVLVYEPRAIVRHRHRRTYESLHKQISDNGIGFYAHLVRGMRHYPDERVGLFLLGVWWFHWWFVRRWLVSFIRPYQLPRELITSEMRNVFKGLFRYQKAHRKADELAKDNPTAVPFTPQNKRSLPADVQPPNAIAVRQIELAEPLRPLTDVAVYNKTQLFMTLGGQACGRVDINNLYQPISVTQLREEIARKIKLQGLRPGTAKDSAVLRAEILQRLKQRWKGTADFMSPVTAGLPLDKKVSVVIATRDRPQELNQCLASLVQQDFQRPVEIIVVDNNPSSGQTAPVVVQYPTVQLVCEPRPGVSYARNAGILLSTAPYIVTLEDNVILPQGWLENLLTPLARQDVMLVSGNVLPYKLDSPPEQYFESYAGLSCGFDPREFTRRWFDRFTGSSVPTWLIGGMANAACRAEIFYDPRIGPLEEALGPGTPTGGGEDRYLFYKLLKAGYGIVYNPAAFVWHQHGCSMKTLQQQLYHYGKGNISYQLATLRKDGDRRALFQVFYKLPRWHLSQLWRWVRGQGAYPLSCIWLEIRGNLAGPWAYWYAHRLKQRFGPSTPAQPHPDAIAPAALPEPTSVPLIASHE